MAACVCLSLTSCRLWFWDTGGLQAVKSPLHNNNNNTPCQRSQHAKLRAVMSTVHLGPAAAHVDAWTMSNVKLMGMFSLGTAPLSYWTTDND